MFGVFLKLFKLVHKVEGPKNVVKQPMNKNHVEADSFVRSCLCLETIIRRKSDESLGINSEIRFSME